MCSDIYDAQTIRLLLIVHAYMDSGLVSQRLYNWAGSIGAFQVMMAKWPDVVPNTASYVVDAIFVVVFVEKAFFSNSLIKYGCAMFGDQYQ